MNRLTAAFRPREPRTTVLVPCRVKLDGGWTDARIHNVSSRGLMLAIENPPPRGTYIDIRRGTLVIIGRVMWRQQNFVGVRTQDAVSAAMLTGEPAGRRVPSAGEDLAGERRASSRLEQETAIARRIDRHRHLARMLQFAVLIAVVAMAALVAAASVFDLLGGAFASVRRALGG